MGAYLLIGVHIGIEALLRIGVLITKHIIFRGWGGGGGGKKGHLLKGGP